MYPVTASPTAIPATVDMTLFPYARSISKATRNPAITALITATIVGVLEIAMPGLARRDGPSDVARAVSPCPASGSASCHHAR